MKSRAILGFVMLTFLLGAVISSSAERNDKDWKDHGNPHARGPEQRDQGHGNRHEAERRGPNRDVRGEHGNPHYREVSRPAPRYAHRDIWARERARDWAHEHHSWRERGGYRGYRIPEARFHEDFGRGHWFRVHDVPVVVVEGAPRFQFGGLWFTLVDPCPETWSPVWYRTDEVYIDYVHDGYYMFNRRHPGVAIAVNVSL